MTHEELNELYELYALGLLEGPAASEIERHLEEGCEYCREHVQRAFWTTSSLAGLAEAVNAPRSLRNRVVEAVRPSPRPARSWMFATGGLSAVSLGLLGVALWSANQTQSLHSNVDALTSQRDDFQGQVRTLTSERRQLLTQDQTLHNTISTLNAERNDLQGRSQSLVGERSRLTNEARTLQSTVETLTAERDGLRGRLQTVEAERAQLLSQRQNALSTVQALTSERDDLRGRVRTLDEERNQLLNQRGELQSIAAVVGNSGTRALQFGGAGSVPQGRVFLPPTGGVVLVGSRLPQLPPDRTFQLWLVPAQGAPRSAGVFRSNASGEVIYSSQVSRSGLNPAAVAVSVEPQGGSPAPTTKPFIVVPLKS